MVVRGGARDRRNGPRLARRDPPSLWPGHAERDAA